MLSTRQRQRLKDLRTIVDENQYKELDGYVVDVQTANCIVTLHDSLNPANRRRLLNLSLPEAQRVSIKLLTAE